jgi:hypothetical protein
MQSRQPRLGDILDDYCPRERRLTNHAVVAMIGDEIKQTRCTTCDAEHEYKHAKIPAQRKKKTGTGALYDEVLAGGPAKLSPLAVSPPVATRPAPAETIEPAADEPLPLPVQTPEPAAAPAAPPAPVAAAPQGDEVDGPVHRQLIRATLPRPEGQVKERAIPEFTARTAAVGRGGRFRPHGGGGGGQGQGHSRGGQAPGANGNHAGGNRFGRRGPGPFASAGAGNRPQPPQGERQGEGRRRRGGRNRTK